MAASTSSTAASTTMADPKVELIKQTVYQKNGNLFFRTSIQKATTSEKNQLELAKAKLGKLNPT